MGLVIHDLTPEAWEPVRRDYAGWTVVSDTGTIRPCTGCFSCWNRTPGKCVIRDGYENMGELIHRADRVTVISRYTFGGFSGFVKNVFDRCLGYVLPQFEVVGGETHHKKRYEENKPFTFVFYGAALSEEEKNSASRYVKAVCANIRGHVREVRFAENGPAAQSAPRPAPSEVGKVLLLNGSMRHRSGNSAALADRLAASLSRETRSAALTEHLADLSALLPALEEASDLVLCLPLYVDGLPSQVIRFMEWSLGEYRGGAKRVYVLANMGLYESSQLTNLFEAVRQWCAAMGFEYLGGLGVSAGELIGALIRHTPFGLGPTAAAARGVARLAEAIGAETDAGEILAGPTAFPRRLYILIANRNWNRTARKNDIRPRDLYRRL